MPTSRKYTGTWRRGPGHTLHALATYWLAGFGQTERLACNTRRQPIDGDFLDYRYTSDTCCQHRACAALFNNPENPDG